MIYCIRCHAAKYLHGAIGLHSFGYIAGKRVRYPTCDRFTAPSLWRRLCDWLIPRQRALRRYEGEARDAR